MISEGGGNYKIRPQAIDTYTYIISLFMVQALHVSAEENDNLDFFQDYKFVEVGNIKEDC